MNPEPFFPDGGRMGVEGLEDRAIMPRRRLMGIFAVVQEDPCSVFVPDAHVDMRRLKIKLPGADNELVLAYDRHRRHIHLQEARPSSRAGAIVSHRDTTLARVSGGWEAASKHRMLAYCGRPLGGFAP